MLMNNIFHHDGTTTSIKKTQRILTILSIFFFKTIITINIEAVESYYTVPDSKLNYHTFHNIQRLHATSGTRTKRALQKLNSSRNSNYNKKKDFIITTSCNNNNSQNTIYKKKASKTDITIIRSIAIEALLPVFFHPYIDAEKASKKCLNKIRRNSINNNNINITTNENGYNTNEIRKYVSSIILGTSIMKLRHWFVHFSQQQKQQQQQKKGFIWLDDYFKDIDNSEEQMKVIGALVDQQIVYLNNDGTTPDITFPESMSNSKRLALTYSLPPFLTNLFIEQYGKEEAENIANISNYPGPITFRRNMYHCESDDILCQCLYEHDDILAKPLDSNSSSWNYTMPTGSIRLISPKHPKSIWGTYAYKNNYMVVQDLGSQYLATSCGLNNNLKKKEIVIIDYCAGNGGKTFALLDQMIHYNIKGMIIAHDVHPIRIQQLQGQLNRFYDLDLVKQKYNISVHTTTNIMNSSFQNNIKADIVLVDVPCSSTGVLRRRPSQRWMITEEDILYNLPKLQFDILQNASYFVEPNGGCLLYSTCSILESENEFVARSFENNNNNKEECSWYPWNFEDSAENKIDVCTNLNWRRIPLHKSNSDGFFIARWKNVYSSDSI